VKKAQVKFLWSGICSENRCVLESECEIIVPISTKILSSSNSQGTCSMPGGMALAVNTISTSVFSPQNRLSLCIKTWLLSNLIPVGYVHFCRQRSTDAFVIWSGTLITSRLLIGGSIIFRFQITNTQTVLWPYIISIIQLQQNEHKFKYPFPYSLFLSLKLPSVGIMVLCRNVTKDDNILCELYADTFREVFDDCETEIWYSDTSRQVVHLNSLS
jgi:hypothetical protein